MALGCTCSARKRTPFEGRSSSKVSPRMGLNGFHVRSLPPNGPMQKPATHAQPAVRKLRGGELRTAPASGPSLHTVSDACARPAAVRETGCFCKRGTGIWQLHAAASFRLSINCVSGVCPCGSCPCPGHECGQVWALVSYHKELRLDNGVGRPLVGVFSGGCLVQELSVLHDLGHLL